MVGGKGFDGVEGVGGGAAVDFDDNEATAFTFGKAAERC